MVQFGKTPTISISILSFLILHVLYFVTHFFALEQTYETMPKVLYTQ
jgi:hypothetical protein